MNEPNPAPETHAATEAIHKICPAGLLNSPGIYFLLHRPTKRAYVGVVKSIAQHAAYLRGQFARCAKGKPPLVKLANMPAFDDQFDNWVFRAFPVNVDLNVLVQGNAVFAEAQDGAFNYHSAILRKVLADKGVNVVNTHSRRRGPNRTLRSA
jgi:hypothetical protein